MVIIPEPQRGIDKRVLDWLRKYGIRNLEDLTEEKLKLVEDFVQSISDAIDQDEESDQVRLLN